ncbi:hypothetical protein BGZ95_008056, partial [Linnemannia exigua]
WEKMKATFAKSAKKIQKIWLEYDKDWSPFRKDMFASFGSSEEDFMNIPTVDVEPGV